jgi:hypothetical protein
MHPKAVPACRLPGVQAHLNRSEQRQRQGAPSTAPSTAATEKTRRSRLAPRRTQGLDSPGDASQKPLVGDHLRLCTDSRTTRSGRLPAACPGPSTRTLVAAVEHGRALRARRCASPPAAETRPHLVDTRCTTMSCSISEPPLTCSTSPTIRGHARQRLAALRRRHWRAWIQAGGSSASASAITPVVKA